MLLLLLLRKFWLLIWKNMLLRRRHWIVTTFEVLLPTLCAGILAYSNRKLFTELEEDPNLDLGSLSGKGGPTIKIINEKIFDPKDARALIQESLQKKALCVLGCPYAPSNEHTQQIMSFVSVFLALHGVPATFYGLESEEEIEDQIVKESLKPFLSGKRFEAAFVFESGYPVTGNKDDGSISYKIRLKYKYSSYVSSKLGEPIMPIDDTEKVFPDEVLDPDDPSGYGEEQKESYIRSGFIALQLAIDTAIVKSLDDYFRLNYEVSIQAFPIPRYAKREEELSLAYLFHSMVLPTFLVLGFIFIVPSVMLGVVSERESGIRELLKMNGVPGWLQWIGWLVNSLIILVLSVSIVTILLFLDIIKYGDPGVWFFVLIMYMISATLFCFFLSSFFVRPILATIVGIIIWLVSYFPVFAIFELYSGRVTFSHKLWACLSPNVAFYLAVKTMMTYERDGVGAQWSNVATPVSPGHLFSLGYIILMLFANSVLFMLLTMYLENVLPTEYGVRKPFYYIFLPSTWGIGCNRKPKVSPTPIDSTPPPGFEPDPTNIPVGIQIKNLRKTYDRKKVAVDNVTLKMFCGEIFVLLGHNGAGKTTTISMLTGICAPSGGTAEINGIDISRNLEKVRGNLGLCPQHNMLFEKLTVDEHLTFFGRLKGFSGKAADKELQELMEKLQLWEKRNTLAKHLSGGQKRKLHLGIALIGRAGVAILDEPTSGMDPEARRAIWDVLLEIRGERTILLTTHFMEEADVLGDRVAIMASGRIQCCGTTAFLKKYYGSGYTLKLTLGTTKSLNSSHVSLNQAASSHSSVVPVSSETIEEVLAFVQRHVPDAYLKETQSANASELFITLPRETATTAALTQMFTELPVEKDKWDIKTVGMSPTTVDEVFLKVGELAEKSNPSDDEQEPTNPSYISRPTSPSTCQLALIQFSALLLKKIIYTYRKRKLIICQLLIPVILLIGAILSCNEFFAPSGHPAARKITLTDYPNPIVPINTPSDPDFKLFSAVIGKPAFRIIPFSQNFIDTLLKTANLTLNDYNHHYIIGAEKKSNQFKVLYSTVPNHAAPLAVNTGTNAILEEIAPGKYKVQVTNHPIRTDVKLILGSTRPDIDHIFYATILFEVFMPIGLALLAATFIVLPMEEKLCKVKQLQLMSILHPAIYWGSAFVWDFFVVIVVICMMIACFPIFQSHEMYTSYGGGGVAFLILAVYGYCAIFFSYLMSHFAKTVHGGFAFVTIIHIISGLIIGIVVSALDMLVVFTPQSSTRTFLQTVGRLFPTYGAVISTTRYVETAIDNGRCNVLTKEVKKHICEDLNLNIAEVEYLECCDQCKEFKMLFDSYVNGRSGRSGFSQSKFECFEPKPYVLWENPRESLQATEIMVPGIAQELTYMVIMSVVYQVLLMGLEYRHFFLEMVEGMMGRRGRDDKSGEMFAPDADDEDVAEEARRIGELVGEGRFYEDALIVKELRKSFGGFAAVRMLSFGVHFGECFGLLGVNGAGKTTTFRMLTGDETPSDGVVYAFAKSLRKDRTRYLASIGYCPQFDGVIGVLTGREMLKLFCCLRGISGRLGDLEADRWLKRLGLSKSATVQCRKYSGGMKRRLCAAISMIGDPEIIFLDEPTSGVDPVSRRQFWKVLRQVRKSGQSIILTSHSMEECEALCSRLAIMVNGKLQCLGGVQHLKSKFAQGYSLSLKMKPSATIESEEYLQLHQEITDKFQPCTVKDKHNNFIQYEIQNASLTWEFLFKTMEELKEVHGELVEDYSVNETTLEEVFLSFARKQYGDRFVNTKCLFCCK